MDGLRILGTVVRVEYYRDLFQTLGIEVVKENEVDWLALGSSSMEPRYGFFERVDTKNIEPMQDSGQEGESNLRSR